MSVDMSSFLLGLALGGVFFGVVLGLQLDQRDQEIKGLRELRDELIRRGMEYAEADRGR